ncbi:MAG: FtsQ-type POTRA domain-containing protein [Oligoflexia bacterium]|nr:FtsQ-type POTRA domain-containing protein [Oligoflexia bacterium]
MRYLFVLFFIGMIGTGLWQGLMNSNIVKLKKIEINGASSATTQRLRGLLKSKIGDAFWEIPVSQEAQSLKTDPWVEAVEVRRELLGTLIIDIIERKPVAVLGNGKGQFYFLDGHSDVIDQAQASRVGAYPILSESGFHSNKELRTKALEILKSLPAEGLLSLSDVSEVQYDNEQGYHLTLAKTGIVIDIGKENLPLHLDRARRVVQYLDQHKINATRIDADYSKKVLVKVRGRR